MKKYIMVFIFFTSIVFSQDIINKISRKFVIMTQQDTLLTLLNDGRLGLGIGNPIGGLHLTTDSASVIFDNSVWDGAIVWKLDQWSLDGSFRINMSDVYGSNINTPVIVTTDGNVGIWTIAPTNRLHVVSDHNPLRLEGVLEAPNDENILTIDQIGEVHWRNIEELGGTDDQKIDVASLSGNNIQLSLESDREATKTIDISTATAIAANTAKVTDDDDGVAGVYGAGWNNDTDSPTKNDVYDKIESMSAGSDDQKFDVATLVGNTLNLSLEDDSEATKTFDISTITAITANTAKVTNATHTGDVTGSGALTIGANKVLESHLKAVNPPTDEYALTYESTSGDFEWQATATNVPYYVNSYDGRLSAEKLLEAGTDADGSVTFTGTFSATPVITSNILKNEDNSTVGYSIHIKTRSTTGFTYEVRMIDEFSDEKISITDKTGSETIMWIAVEP